jgi:hypothetical protein
VVGWWRLQRDCYRGDADSVGTFDILPMVFLRFCVDMVVVLVRFWLCPLMFFCVACRKGGVVRRNYLPRSGAVGPDQ